jgi:hypothetical protein
MFTLVNKFICAVPNKLKKIINSRFQIILMANHDYQKNGSEINENFIKFTVDKPLRIFVGELNGDTIRKTSTEGLEGFKDGDKVVVMHSEDWLWFTNELLKNHSI